MAKADFDGILATFFVVVVVLQKQRGGGGCLFEENQYQTVKHNCNQRSINGNRYTSLHLRAMRQ